MAEPPELWKDLTPERKPLFGRDPSFGVARELERVRQGGAAPVKRRPVGPHVGPERHGAWATLRRRWAVSRHHPSDIWHRLMCRRGRHDIRGGHQIQLGSSFVNIERRCLWCDIKAGPR
jgi:hypothetical protein